MTQSNKNQVPPFLPAVTPESWRLAPEYAPQAAIMLAWPHEHTDWAPMLEKAQKNVAHIIAAVSQTATPWLLIPHDRYRSSIEVQVALALEECGYRQKHDIAFSVCDYEDTWTRDYGPLCVFKPSEQIGQKHLRLQNFVFNGWGGKFTADKDNQVNQKLWDSGEFERVYTSSLHQDKLFSVQLQQHDLILEGGSLETNGKIMLTTKACLLNPNRNQQMKQDDIQTLLKKQFGIKDVLWLSEGHLEGDDTDAHIDTLARFINQDTIVYQGCQDIEDSHYTSLQEMKSQLEAMAKTHEFTLIELPWPKAQYDQDRRLPATYANFLLLNGQILLPTYNCDVDALAIETLETKALTPSNEPYTIIPIDCCALIQNNGSLHCSTMQLPHIWSRS